MAVQIARRLFTVDEYEEMIDTGILKEDERVELIYGEIVKMAPIGTRHEACVRRLDLLLHEKLGRTAIVSVQNSIRLPNNSQPQPDVAVLRWHNDFYAGERPTPEDILLLVEVADTSLGADRSIKVPIYARAGVSEVWIVNLQEDMIEVYTSPTADVYQNVRRVGPSESLSLPGGLDASVDVADILA